MSERVSPLSLDQIPSSNPCCFKTLVESLQIFPGNKRVFLFIFVFLTFPSSLLLFSLSLSSYSVKSKIFRLEFLASLSHTHFEARHVWMESRQDAVSLLHLKLFYFFPSYVLSLLTAVTAVVTTDSTYNKKPINLRTAVAAIKPTWTRPLVTSICIYAILLLYSSIPRTLVAIIGGTSPWLRLLIWIIGLAVELYITAVLGMGLVVSIVERRFGWDAIRFASGLMEGKRVRGWALSGLLAMVTGVIGWRTEGLMMDGEDLSWEKEWTVAMVVESGWETMALVGLYGVVVVWGFVITTVFYCECRNRHVIREDEDQNADC